MNPISRIPCAIALGLLISVPALAEIRISEMEGPVEVGRGDPVVWAEAATDQVLGAGHSVRTGPGGRVELALGSGRTARVYENSVLRLPGVAKNGADAVPTTHLSRGHSLFDITPGSSPSGFEVRTPEVVVSVKGTRFMVAAPDAGPHGTSVFRGAVAMSESGTGSESVRVVPGLMALLEGQHIRLGETPFNDPWDSFGATAPGLSMPASLGGAEQELTRRLVVESGRLERALRTVGIERIESPPAAAAESTGMPAMDSASDVQRKMSEAGMMEQNAQRMPLVSVLTGPRTTGAPNSVGNPGGGFLGGGANFPFGFQQVNSGGTNKLIVSFGGNAVSLHQTDILKIQSGDLTPYGSFLQTLQGLGVDPVDLADFIDNNYL
jgi:hypothetical protein